MQASLDRLDPKRAAVISARHGLGGGEVETLDQIGRRLGVTRERVRQLEQTGMRELSKTLRVTLRHEGVADDFLGSGPVLGKAA